MDKNAYLASLSLPHYNYQSSSMFYNHHHPSLLFHRRNATFPSSFHHRCSQHSVSMSSMYWYHHNTLPHILNLNTCLSKMAPQIFHYYPHTKFSKAIYSIPLNCMCFSFSTIPKTLIFALSNWLPQAPTTVHLLLHQL